MASKEFKNLNKAELLEVIYRLQMREKSLAEKAERWKAKADERYDQLEKSGNIAEAALSVNGFFTAAQKAAEDYVQAVSARADEKEQKARSLLEKTQQIACSIQDFLGELEGEEMGLDSFRLQIAQILEELALYLPQQEPQDSQGEAQ